MVFILVAMANAVNLTDGLDGLCSGSAATVSLFYPAMLVSAGYALAGRQLSRLDAAAMVDLDTYMQSAHEDPFVAGGIGVNIHAQAGFFAAIAGACIGFLMFNRHPAKIFMGDTGSLAIGGAMAVAAIWSRAELLIPIAGALFVIEALSVIIQVSSYRFRGGKRVFKMAPLHHHFELSGWDEAKVVKRFTAFTVIMCVVLLTVLIVQAHIIVGNAA
jgi:phospho-N-acetylmuramoyl-pentapeptide-transferase